MGLRQYRLLIFRRLGLREAELDAMEDPEFAAVAAEALWLEEREIEVMAAAFSRALPSKG